MTLDLSLDLSLILRRTLVLAAFLGATAAAPAHAATSATGAQAITGTADPTLTATFPGAYTMPALVPGTTVSSTSQVVNVKSNASWGVKVSSDAATGLMRRWDGSSYVAGNLASSMTWVPTAGGTAAALSSTAASVVTAQSSTNDSGIDVGVTFGQPVSFGDGSGVHRIAVTYAAEQGF